jgi:hypothetical protein
MMVQFGNEGSAAVTSATASVNFFRAVDTTLVCPTLCGVWHAEGEENKIEPQYVSKVNFEPNGERWWLELAVKEKGATTLHALDAEHYGWALVNTLPDEALRVRVVIRGQGMPSPLIMWFRLLAEGRPDEPIFDRIRDRKLLRFLNTKVPPSVVIA